MISRAAFVSGMWDDPALYLGFGKSDTASMMRITLKCLLTAAFALPLSGCLAQRTVTEGGQTVKQEYVIKRPLKEAVQNSR